VSSSEEKDFIKQAALMLVRGKTTEEAQSIKESAEIKFGEPLRKLIIHHLGENTDLKCPEKKKIANDVIDDFYKGMEF